MMKKILVILLVGLMAVGNLFAQESKSPTNAVFVELGGAGMMYSFNYDTRFDKGRLESWGIRAGIGGFVISEESFLAVPVQLNKLFGKRNHYFELGVGATLVNYKGTYTNYYSNGSTYEETDKSFHFILDMGETPSVMGTLNFGYRKIPNEEGFMWRVNLTPLFNGDGFWPLFARVGFGYAF